MVINCSEYLSLLNNAKCVQMCTELKFKATIALIIYPSSVTHIVITGTAKQNGLLCVYFHIVKAF